MICTNVIAIWLELLLMPIPQVLRFSLIFSRKLLCFRQMLLKCHR